ncbi:50S ribosomal protein L25 [Clostridium botulinum D/C]|nr:50S ribosomal protein L25 [Clostridium botulinum D/C]MCD3360973.1 50S ribosomal protein L25 [Clostridium botulinum D/C]MCD3364059.1 50S ribosomal protein L25 [Clostridium botulinum D/C]MCD3366713.1 50S ribosomal protein L25 [Clostridium botulinum D/C]
MLIIEGIGGIIMEVLKAEERVKDSVHSARRERKKGMVPGVLYGAGIQNLLFEIGELELNREVLKHGEHGGINLEINNRQHQAIVKEVQKDPVTKKIIHVDLQEVNKEEIVQTEIPIVFKGEELISKRGDTIQKEKSNIRVKAKYDDIPSHINIDLSRMSAGDVCRINDVEMSSEITCLDDMDTILAVVMGRADNRPDTDELEAISQESVPEE